MEHKSKSPIAREGASRASKENTLDDYTRIQQNLASPDCVSGDNFVNDNEPRPLPDLLPKVLPFKPEMLPKSFGDYVLDVAKRQQCPTDFIAVTAVCSLAALLGRKALMCPKQNDDWTVTPNLWGALIGRPSAMKSSAMKAALKPLKEIEDKVEQEYEIARKKFEVNKLFSEVNIVSAKSAAKKQIKDGKYAKAKAILEEASFTDLKPIRKRLVVNDATIEKLGELLNENPNGLILVRDELSDWLANLSREEYQMDRAFYLECFDGDGQYIYDRIGRGTIVIKNTTLSIVGGIQPSKISPLIRDAIRGSSDDGLVQRLQLVVWPDETEVWEWIDRVSNEEVYFNYENTFQNLFDLNFDTNNGEPPCFRFTIKAQKLFQDWMEKIQVTARKNDLHPALESHFLKMPQTIASLALLFQILYNILPDNKITPNLLTERKFAVDELATVQALEWAVYLKSHAERLYSIGINQAVEGARLILKRIDKLKDRFTAREIQRKGWVGLNEPRIIEEALDYLVDYNHLGTPELPSTFLGGRPTTYYFKNKIYAEINLE